MKTQNGVSSSFTAKSPYVVAVNHKSKCVLDPSTMQNYPAQKCFCTQQVDLLDLFIIDLIYNFVLV